MPIYVYEDSETGERVSVVRSMSELDRLPEKAPSEGGEWVRVMSPAGGGVVGTPAGGSPYRSSGDNADYQDGDLPVVPKTAGGEVTEMPEPVLEELTKLAAPPEVQPFTPLGARVVVEVLPFESTTKSGLHLAGGSEQSTRGRVIFVGPGERVPNVPWHLRRSDLHSLSRAPDQAYLQMDQPRRRKSEDYIPEDQMPEFITIPPELEVGDVVLFSKFGGVPIPNYQLTGSMTDQRQFVSLLPHEIFLKEAS